MLQSLDVLQEQLTVLDEGSFNAAGPSPRQFGALRGALRSNL